MPAMPWSGATSYEQFARSAPADLERLQLDPRGFPTDESPSPALPDQAARPEFLPRACPDAPKN